MPQNSFYLLLKFSKTNKSSDDNFEDLHYSFFFQFRFHVFRSDEETKIKIKLQSNAKHFQFSFMFSNTLNSSLQ